MSAYRRRMLCVIFAEQQVNDQRTIAGRDMWNTGRNNEVHSVLVDLYFVAMAPFTAGEGCTCF